MEDRATILIVDDEAAIRLFLSEELSAAGYAVLEAASGEEALALLQEKTIDILLLDLKMGGMDGLLVMEEVKKQLLPPVVIVLTAYASLDSAVGAMRRGGYDYLTKPCRTEELLASVAQGLAKRRRDIKREEMIRSIEKAARQLRGEARLFEEAEAIPRYLEGRGLMLDRKQKVVTKLGQVLHLTPTELDLLTSLMERANQPLSYRELATALHGRRGGEWKEWEAHQNLSTHMWRLRRKLGEAPDSEPYIVNIRGRGYKFVDPP